MAYKELVTMKMEFSGLVDIVHDQEVGTPTERHQITGTWTDRNYSLVCKTTPGQDIVAVTEIGGSSGRSIPTAEGEDIVVEGCIGEYFCPYHQQIEQVVALTTSELEGDIEGHKFHRIFDSVVFLSGGHSNVSVVTVEGYKDTRCL